MSEGPALPEANGRGEYPESPLVQREEGDPALCGKRQAQKGNEVAFALLFAREEEA